MRCPVCGSPLSNSDRTCPDCGWHRGGAKALADKPPARSRGPAVLACLLGTPAWLVALPCLCLSIGVRGEWRWLEPFGVLTAAISLFLVLIRRIEWDGLALVIASVAGWLLIARLVMPLGFLSFLALLPIGAMAAVAAILGGWALVRDGDGDTTTQAMALLGCSSLPLFLAAIYLLECSRGPQPSWTPPPLVPPGRPIPSPKAAVVPVGVAAPSPRNPVMRYRDVDRGPDQFERPSVRDRRAVRSDPSILEPRMAGRENTQERSARCS